MILLDTNIVIAFLNGNNAVSERIQRKIDRIALSTLVVAELDYGAKASQNARKNLEKLYRLLDIVQVISFDMECAKIFGTIKSKLRSIGKPTGEVDALLAATAIANKAVLITANKKHFENIEGLKLEVWQTD
ncbi:type II toxin-antitoxin system VapC family toxin [Thermodesulfovibrionales bacterium]|nr:type II toxin-antitoxin system VapC family toxin [Thermodesulfovibrionales bacterium]